MSIRTKADMLELESVARSDDPSVAFDAAEEYMEKIDSVDLLSNNELPMHFVQTHLPRIITTLLKRSDLDEDLEERGYHFLERTLIFVARTIETGIESLAVILDDIFMERQHPFYKHSISRDPGTDIMVEVAGDSGTDVFEEEESARRAVYAERNAGRRYARRNQRSNAEGRLICHINAFGRSLGFRSIRHILLQQTPTTAIGRIRVLLSPLFEVKEFLTTDFLDWMMSAFPQVANMLLSLSDEEFKNDFRNVQEVAECISALYRLTSKKDSLETVDKFRLDLALKGFRSRYLERRITGLGDINEFIEAVDETSGMRQDNVSWSCWADDEFLCQWLIDNEILDGIFVHNVHSEILKRSHRVLLFLAYKGNVGDVEVRKMWDASLEKHESIQKLILELIGQAARNVDSAATLKGLLDLIGCQDPSAFTMQHIDLIQRIASLIVQSEAQSADSDFDPFVGVALLWKITQDDFALSTRELHNAGLGLLIRFVQANECRAIRGDYFGKCLANLKNHRSVPQSLFVMNTLLMSTGLKRKKPDQQEWSSYGFVHDEKELLQVILDDLVWYQRFLKEKNLKFDDQLEEGHTVSSMYPTQEQLEQRLFFMTTILNAETTEVTEDILNMLWETLVEKSVDEKQVTIALNWLQDTLARIIGKECCLLCAEFLFNKLCEYFKPADMSEIGLSVFHSTLSTLNWKKGKMERNTCPQTNHSIFIPCTAEALEGVTVLWEVAINAKNEAVATRAISYLIELHLSTTLQPYRKVREAKSHQFVARCMEYLQAAASTCAAANWSDGPVSQVYSCIVLLRNFLPEFECGSAILRSASLASQAGNQEWNTITLKVQPPAQANKEEDCLLTIHKSCSIGNLRKLIAGQLDLDIRLVRLLCKGAELKNDEDTVEIHRLSDGDVLMVALRDPAQCKESDSSEMAVDPSPMERVRSPHDILAQEYFDPIFDLLEAPEGISARAWELLLMLPTNQKRLHTLMELTDHWDDYLSATNMYNLLYTLQILEKVLDQDSDQLRRQVLPLEQSWRKKFLNAGGVQKLLKLLLGQEFSLASMQQNECLALLLKLVTQVALLETHSAIHLLTPRPEPSPKNEAPPRTDSDGSVPPTPTFGGYFSVETQKPLMHGLLKVIGTAASQQAHGEGEKVANSASEGVKRVVNHACKLLVLCTRQSSTMTSHIYSYPDIDQWLRDTLLLNNDIFLRQLVMRCIASIAGCMEENYSMADKASSASDADMETDSSNSPLHPLLFFLKHLFPLTCEVETGSMICVQLFDTVDWMLRQQCVGMASRLNQPHMAAELQADFASTILKLFESTIFKMVAELKSRPIIEETNGDREDLVLQGFLRCLQTIFAIAEGVVGSKLDLKEKVGLSAEGCAGLLHYVFHECLFMLPAVDRQEGSTPPKCKHPKTRAMAFDLLTELAHNCLPTYKQLVFHLSRQHLGKPETRPLHGFNPEKLGKSSCAFVGIRNLGATCYMNSLLQQLFFVPEFRKGIFQVPIEEGDKSGSLMYQLQSLFGHLQEGEKQFAEPWDLCQAYTDYDGQPVNIAQQMDVDEYFNMLLEKLEACLKGTNNKHLLQECFGGKLVNQIICKDTVKIGDKTYGPEDPFKSEREESFSTLQLEVKHKRTILESLDSYVEGEVLEGDNKYFCEEANQKVDAIKRVCIKELPRTLILHLKRFEFDLDFMKKVKVNDSCEFPTELDMEPYTRDGIEKRERGSRSGRSSSTVSMGDSNTNTMYELVGVLVHTGTADSGHYYSYIKTKPWASNSPDAEAEGKWYLFNDTQVEPFDEEEIGAACFGGDYLQPPDSGDGMPNSQVGTCMSRTYNAYMLIYRRKTVEDDTSAPQGKPAIPDQILKTVRTENIQFLQDRHIFDKTYLEFARKICSFATHYESAMDVALSPRSSRAGSNSSSSNIADLASNVLQLTAVIMMDTVIHGCHTSEIREWAGLIQSLLVREPAYLSRSRWLLERFVMDIEDGGHIFMCHWLYKALLTCRVSEVRLSFVNLLLHALEHVAQAERTPDWTVGMPLPFCEVDEALRQEHDAQMPRVKQQNPLRPRANTCIGKFIDKALSLIPELPPNWRHFSEYFRLLSAISNLSIQERAFLISRRTVARVVNFFLHEESPFAHEHRYRNRMGDKFSAPCFMYLMELVSDLVRSTEIEREVDNRAEWKSCVQLEPVGPFPDNMCLALASHKSFLKKILGDGIHPDKTLMLLKHLCWNHPRNSVSVLTCMCEIIETEEEYGIIFKHLHALLEMDDEIKENRAESFSLLFQRAIHANLQYPESCASCLHFLAEQVVELNLIRLHVIKTIVLSHNRRDSWRWFEACLLKCDVDIVRVAAEKLGIALALPTWNANAIAGESSRSSSSMSSSSSGSSGNQTYGDQQTKALFDNMIGTEESLLSQLAVEHARQCEQARQGLCLPSPLQPYFRCLTTIVKVTDWAWCKAQFRKHFNKFYVLLERMDHLHVELDTGKAQLVAFWLACAKNYPEVLEVLTDQFSGVRDLLVGHYIMIRVNKQHYLFNREHTPTFYNLLLLCCKYSTSFTDFFMSHQNSIWAIENFVCNSQRYPETMMVLLELVDVALTSQTQQDTVNRFKLKLLNLIKGNKRPSPCPENIMALAKRLADDIMEDADEVLQALDSPILDMAFATLSQLGPSAHPDRRRDDVLINTVEFLLRMFKAFETHDIKPEIVSNAVKKFRNRVAATSALFSHLKSNAISADLRLSFLDLCSRLCAVDDQGCALTGIHELQKCYGAQRLTPLPDLRKVIKERKELKSGKGESAATQQGDEEWMEEVALNMPLELWPLCRGEAEELTEELEDAYWELVIQLNRQAVETTCLTDDMPHIISVLRLLMASAIDAMQGPDQESVQTAFAELINLWIENSNEEALVPEEDTSADNPPGPSEPTEDAAGQNRFMAALLNEEYMKAWLLRLLTCYKEFLKCDVVFATSQRVLDLLHQHWPTDQNLMISSLISKDIASSIAKSAKEGAKESGPKSGKKQAAGGAGQGEAGAAAQAATEELMLNLRPLTVLACSPSLASQALGVIDLEGLREAVGRSNLKALDPQLSSRLDKLLGQPGPPQKGRKPK